LETAELGEPSAGPSWPSIVSLIRIQAEREPPPLRQELEEWADLIEALAGMSEL
jgi:hypothetical protein